MNEEVTKRTIGLNFNEEGRAEVRVWAPEATGVSLVTGKDTLALLPQPMGYWTLSTDKIKPGDRYSFSVNGGEPRPDPASLSQPEGVHQPSEAVDLVRFPWTDSQWKNPAICNYIIYELHTGTFTPGGRFEDIGSRLDYLVSLGITAIELMPLAAFPGNRNWGYDGVYPFAVQHSYGGPEALQQLVNSCHEKGLAVILDVVYNHLGPEGNYLGNFGPYITEKYKTPWGGAINFDDAWCDGVRDYYLQNALMWFRDFHIDALRLDAVHAIRDFSPVHLLQSIREAVDELMKITDKCHYLMVESDLNDTRFINPLLRQGYGMDAQWMDEFHHALRSAATNEKTGYYSDFNGVEHLAKSYRDAYVYDGQFSTHRKKNFGIKTSNPGQQFIVFSQNHDQTGNRMMGERTSVLVSFEMQKLMAAAVLLSPFLPLLFMGEEWGETNPFLYFVSHTDPQLAEAVRQGRKAEFSAFHLEGEAPDPMDEKTFRQSTLQWDLKESGKHKTLFNYYKELIRLRKTQPALKELNRKQLMVESNAENKLLVLHRWSDEQHLICVMNFSEKPQSFDAPSLVRDWKKILDSASPLWEGPMEAPALISGGEPGSMPILIQPGSVVVWTDKEDYAKEQRQADLNYSRTIK